MKSEQHRPLLHPLGVLPQLLFLDRLVRASPDGIDDVLKTLFPISIRSARSSIVAARARDPSLNCSIPASTRSLKRRAHSSGLSARATILRIASRGRLE